MKVTDVRYTCNLAEYFIHKLGYEDPKSTNKEIIIFLTIQQILSARKDFKICKKTFDVLPMNHVANIPDTTQTQRV